MFEAVQYEEEAGEGGGEAEAAAEEREDGSVATEEAAAPSAGLPPHRRHEDGRGERASPRSGGGLRGRLRDLFGPAETATGTATAPAVSSNALEEPLLTSEGADDAEGNNNIV